MAGEVSFTWQEATTETQQKLTTWLHVNKWKIKLLKILAITIVAKFNIQNYVCTLITLTLIEDSLENRQGSWSMRRVSLALSNNRTSARNFFKINWQIASSRPIALQCKT